MKFSDAEFVSVPAKVYGFIGAVIRTTFSFKMEVNPTPKAENFIVHRLDRNSTKFPVTLLETLVIERELHQLEITFEATGTGYYVIEFTDAFDNLEQNIFRVISQNFTLIGKYNKSSLFT